MSESPKMGLFGSKDKTKETKKESTKDESPDRYAPYCIDSDSETYDTEALSMMDINDIIGVQSEAVSDSTLESEIAALSEIITESRIEGDESVVQTKCEMLHESMPKEPELVGVDGVETVDTCTTNDQLKDTLEELESVCSVQQITSVCDAHQLIMEEPQSASDSNVLKSVEVNNQTTNPSSNLKDNDELNVLESSSNIDNNKVSDVLIIKNDAKTEVGQPMINLINESVKDASIKETVSGSNVDQQEHSNTIATSYSKTEENTVENISGICGSLQLIGEAYTSEDSQETSINDVETKESSPLVDCKEDPPIESEEQKETDEPSEETSKTVEETCEQNINNFSRISDSASLTETCIKEDVNTPAPVEIESTGADNTRESLEEKITEKLSEVLEDTTDVPNEVEDKIVLSYDTEESKVELTTNSIEVDNVEEDDKEEDVAEDTTEHQDVTMKESEVEVTKEIIDPSALVSISQTEKSETESIEQEVSDKCEEEKVMDIELIPENALCQTENSNTLEIGSNVIDNTPVSTEGTDSSSTDNKIEEKGTEFAETILPVCQTENPTVASSETVKLESPDTTDHCVIQQTETVTLESVQTEQEIPIKELEITEQMECDPLEPLVTELSPKTSQDSEANDSQTTQDNSESSSKTESLFDNAVNVPDNNVVQADIEDTNNNNQEFMAEEVDVRENESADPLIEVSIAQAKIKDEPNACTSVETDVMPKNDVALEEQVQKVKSDLRNINSVSPAPESSEEITDSMEKELDTAENQLKETGNVDLPKVEDCVNENINKDLEKNINEELSEKVNEELGEKINEELGEKINEEVGEKISEELTEKINEELNENINEELRDTMETGKQIELEEIPDTLNISESTEEKNTEIPKAIEEMIVITTEGNVINEPICKTEEENSSIDMLVEKEESIKEELISATPQLKEHEEPGESSTDEEMKESVAEEEMKESVAEEEIKESVAEQEIKESVVDEEMEESVAEDETKESVAEEVAASVIDEEMKESVIEEVEESVIEQVKESEEEQMKESEEEQMKESVIEKVEVKECAIEEEGAEESVVEEKGVKESVIEQEGVKESVIEQEGLKESVIEEECVAESIIEEEEEVKVPVETEEDTKPAQQIKVDKQPDSEIKDNTLSEHQISDLNFIAKDVLSPADQSEIMVPEEDAEEEGMEEEMNLTLDPDEHELQAEMDTSSAESMFEKEPVAEDTEEISKEIERCMEMKDSNIASETINIPHNLDVDPEEATSSENVEISMLNKNAKLINKQELEDNLKNECENSISKSILESEDNVKEMFSEEQCQNTEDIITSILDDERTATDFKNILEPEAGVKEIEKDLHDSTELPLVEAEIAELTEKLPESTEDILNKDIDDPISAQNIDSLEGLLGLDLMQEDSTSKTAKIEEELQEQDQSTTLTKNLDMSLLLRQSNSTSDMEQASDYITDVISNCLSGTSTMSFENNADKSSSEIINDKSVESEASEILKVNDNIIVESIDKEDLEVDTELPENDLDMVFEETPLEAVGDLQETESKLELAPDILLQNVDQNDNLNDTPPGLETSQPSSEISELESAVKFLQESEEQAIDSPLVLSPKLVESVVNDISKQADASSLFVADEDMCEDASELVAELQDIATDSISISEAEIISEAAKLESERKLAEQVKHEESALEKFETDDLKLNIEEKILAIADDPKLAVDTLENIEMQQTANLEDKKITETMMSLSQNVFKASETIPKISILEERLKEPPKIEIPVTDITKLSMSPTTSKDSLLIQKDAKLLAYQRMLESPKLSDKSEPKIMDTPRKDSEKHDFENVGSPRIILKIAKSAITDCGEPRSPKSPKIRSATNSPNPEDSPGQKLGKIKLKLSRSGHPSIISNENVDEAAQWHSEGSASLSPLGMKIKLSKSGDASIVSSEKHEGVEDSKEPKHKYEEIKRTESPIGMKIKLSKSGDASIVMQQDAKDIQLKHKDKLDMVQGSPKRTESPIGMKIKLSKTGDASIIQPEKQDFDEHRDNLSKSKDKSESCYDSPKRTDSPIGMKIKLSKTGDASIVSPDLSEECKETSKLKEKLESSPEIPKRTDSPIGMKIKLAKTKGGASIISVENAEDAKEKLDVPDVPKRTDSPLGMKIKLSKSGDASIVHPEIVNEAKDTKQKEKSDVVQDTTKLSDSGMKIKVCKSGETSMIVQESAEGTDAQLDIPQKVDSPIGMKIKLSKFGDASIVSTEKQEQTEEHKSLQDLPKRTESPLGMKIKLSRTGDASIIQSETSEDGNKSRSTDPEHSKTTDTALGMKIKLLKTGDASIVDAEKKQRRRDTESPLEMKIKLSKTGHPTIIACDSHSESAYKGKESTDFAHRYKDPNTQKETALKMLKSSHSTILQGNRSELTIEPVQVPGKKDNAVEISPKRKDVTISPVEAKKSKLETQLSQILPEVTIQPVMSRDQKQMIFDPKTSLISRQQMNVISQEISITQVRPSKAADTSMSDKLKDILSKNVTGSPINSDCEIIEHRPELIIVNENSNSSQDVVIIEEVPSNRMPEVKIPKKRGRPRRIPITQPMIHPPPQMLVPRDPLSLEESQQAVPHEQRENERPKRTCRSQKSYAPPKRGRGRGRGKRKLEAVDLQMAKKSRIDQDLSAIEASTMSVITIDESAAQQQALGKSPELYKALKQPPMDTKMIIPTDPMMTQSELGRISDIPENASKIMPKPSMVFMESKEGGKKPMEISPEKMQKKGNFDEKQADKVEGIKTDVKDMLVPPGHPNWLTPTSKRPGDIAGRHETVSTVQVIDEETRMSAESSSRSQTPARNIPTQASETIVNEESQGSVLSTATTESEKVKVKNRRMEINFDPDEGPFTVDKIAEYEWPLDRKGETFMIQEQISQYLGVKSFKRKYPDLKRRVVDMEERNYLRENGLVSESMCDMGLTAICSSEVLDVMCSDFPDQYEEYRKHMREKQVKEHSKKQKELTAAANAEKNRIDLAEMAVQSALSWNISLNKARRETRKCSLDLQTFTIHVPKKPQKIDTERKTSHYPVALLAGQYIDYYREYTPAELRYYPLNTVLYGPMRPNERKFDSQSEGSQSDSDSDSSSDDSSSSSSEGTQDTEGSQSTMDEVDMEIVNQKDEIKLKCKMCLKTLNKLSKNEVLIQCGTCNGNVHPSCIDLTLDMVPHIQSYAWQCTDCKTCAQCHDPADEDKMLFCDMCDRGYHIYCVGLRRVPQGRWHCQECAVCANCGSREPGGVNSDRNSVAQWQHEYKKGDKNTRVYVSTLCVPCSKLWRKGRYCPHCSRCHTAPRLDLEVNLVHCSACDKYLHLGCVETKGVVLDRKNYLCDFCTPNRQHVMKPLVSKIFKT